MVSVMGRKPKEENKNITRWPNHLKEMREIFGLTQEDFSSTLNVSRVSISNWENGTGGKMSKNNQEKVSKLFGISSSYIYDIPLDEPAREAILNARVKLQLGEQLTDNDERSGINPYHYVPKASSNSTLSIKSRQKPIATALLKDCNFRDVVEDYMSSVKLLIALINSCDATEIDLAIKINEQLTSRLRENCNLRKKEIDSGNEIETLLNGQKNVTDTTLY
jgi:DNA-binding XRE family transcriptional regulator